MPIYRQTIKGLPLVMERQNLTPTVPIYMVSLQGDPVQFPMVYRKDYGGWIFVDKMTLMEFKAIEKDISAYLESVPSN